MSNFARSTSRTSTSAWVYVSAVTIFDLCPIFSPIRRPRLPLTMQEADPAVTERMRREQRHPGITARTPDRRTEPISGHTEERRSRIAVLTGR
jgi:hypothetical protein